MPALEDLKSWILENKVLTAVLFVILIFILGFASLFFQANMGKMQRAQRAGARAPKAKQELAREAVTRGKGKAAAGEYVEVKQADFQIKSEDAESDASEIRSKTTSIDGYIERSRKEETNLYRTIHLTARIPQEEFTPFTEYLKENFDVESYNLRNYRLGIQRELDELTVLNKTFNDYEKIRGQAREMDNTEKKLELLMKITKKELWVTERIKRYQRQLSEKKQKGEYATVSVGIRERKKVDMWPENLGNRFNSKLKDMTDNVVETLMNTVTGGVELFFKVIQWIVYFLIVVAPLFLIYKLGRKIYERYR